jgi:hypothetical protein
MIVLLLVVAGVILLVLAGANITGRRFAPQWYGLACLAAAFFADVFKHLGGS